MPPFSAVLLQDHKFGRFIKIKATQLQFVNVTLVLSHNNSICSPTPFHQTRDKAPLLPQLSVYQYCGMLYALLITPLMKQCKQTNLKTKQEAHRMAKTILENCHHKRQRHKKCLTGCCSKASREHKLKQTFTNQNDSLEATLTVQSPTQ